MIESGKAVNDNYLLVSSIVQIYRIQMVLLKNAYRNLSCKCGQYGVQFPNISFDISNTC